MDVAMKQAWEVDYWRGVSRDKNAHDDLYKYPAHLMLDPEALRGMKVLDVGCGPLPYAKAFVGCDITGLDELVPNYRNLGYPMDELDYVASPAEHMPFEDASFDAVISVNALDHMADPAAVAAEMMRVSRGFVRLEVHYHEPTTPEPWCINDDLMREWFPTLVKMREVPYTEFCPVGRGSVAVWGTR